MNRYRSFAPHHIYAMLTNYEQLIRETVRLEAETTKVRTRIVEALGNPRRRTRKGAGLGQPRAPIANVVRELLKILLLPGLDRFARVDVVQGADTPLPPREIAHRLGIPISTVTYRIAKAVELGLVERVGGRLAQYKVANVVPELPEV